MCREIKFRAWDKIEKEFIDFCKLTFNENWVFLEEEYQPNHFAEYSFHKDDIELLQFTGLKDKNGVEIYEGDFIECINEEIYTIEWHNNLCCFVGYMEDREYEMFDYVLKAKYIEVIGNIYEKKELLK